MCESVSVCACACVCVSVCVCAIFVSRQLSTTLFIVCQRFNMYEYEVIVVSILWSPCFCCIFETVFFVTQSVLLCSVVQCMTTLFPSPLLEYQL